MNCTQPRLSAQILAWLEGALSPEEASQVEAHVGACVACRDEVAYLRQVSGRVASAFGIQRRAPLASLCPDPGQLVDFAARNLDSAASFVIAEHLLVCAPCEEEVALLLEFESGEGGASGDTVEPPASLALRRAFEDEFRPVAGMKAASPGAASSSGGVVRLGRWAASARRPLGLVATLAVICGVSWMLIHTPQVVVTVAPPAVQVPAGEIPSPEPPPGTAVRATVAQPERTMTLAPAAGKPASGKEATASESKDKGATSDVVVVRAAKSDAAVAAPPPVVAPRPGARPDAPVVVEVPRPVAPARPAVASAPLPSAPTDDVASTRGGSADRRARVAPAPVPAATGGTGAAATRSDPAVAAPGHGSLSPVARVPAPAPARVYKAGPAKAAPRTEEGGDAPPAPPVASKTRPGLKSAAPAEPWDNERSPSNRATPGGSGQQNQAPELAKSAPRQQVVTGGLASQGRPAGGASQNANRSPGESDAAPTGSASPVMVARSRDIQSNASLPSGPAAAQKAVRSSASTSSAAPPPASQAPATVANQTAWQTKSAGEERFRGSSAVDWRESMVTRARQAVTGTLQSQDFTLQLSVVPPSARRQDEVRSVRVHVVVPASTAAGLQGRIRSAVTRALHLDASRGDAVTVSTQ